LYTSGLLLIHIILFFSNVITKYNLRTFWGTRIIVYTRRTHCERSFCPESIVFKNCFLPLYLHNIIHFYTYGSSRILFPGHIKREPDLSYHIIFFNIVIMFYLMRSPIARCKGFLFPTHLFCIHTLYMYIHIIYKIYSRL